MLVPLYLESSTVGVIVTDVLRGVESKPPHGGSGGRVYQPTVTKNRIIEHLNKEVRIRTVDGIFEGLFRSIERESRGFPNGCSHDPRSLPGPSTST